MKNKWKNARDPFVKRMKAGLIGRGQYAYEEELMFLYEMYSVKLKSPSQKSSIVKKSKKRTDDRVKNVQTSHRTLRNKTTVSHREPTLSSGDSQKNISPENDTHRASKYLALPFKNDVTVKESRSNSSVVRRNTRSNSRRTSKRLQLNQNEAVSSEENDNAGEPNSSVGITNGNTESTSKRLRFIIQNETESSEEDDPVEEPNLSTSVGDRNSECHILRASKYLQSNQNEAASFEENNYTVEEPNSSSRETDDASSMEIENGNVGLNFKERLLQCQLRKSLPPFQTAYPSNYLSFVSFPPQSEVDEDTAFFKTLQTWIRKFDEDEKLLFRSGVMNLILKIRNPEAVKTFL